MLHSLAIALLSMVSHSLVPRPAPFYEARFRIRTKVRLYCFHTKLHVLHGNGADGTEKRSGKTEKRVKLSGQKQRFNDYTVKLEGLQFQRYVATVKCREHGEGATAIARKY